MLPASELQSRRCTVGRGRAPLAIWSMSECVQIVPRSAATEARSRSPAGMTPGNIEPLKWMGPLREFRTSCNVTGFPHAHIFALGGLVNDQMNDRNGEIKHSERWQLICHRSPQIAGMFAVYRRDVGIVVCLSVSLRGRSMPEAEPLENAVGRQREICIANSRRTSDCVGDRRRHGIDRALALGLRP